MNAPDRSTLAAYPRLFAALGSEPLPPEHYLSECLADPHGHLLLELLEARYGTAFESERVRWAGDRRSELVRRLRTPVEFFAEDAEVQALASLVEHPGAEVVAQAEGEVDGERRADLLLVTPETVDVEVTILREGQKERETEAIASSIQNRLVAAVGRPGPPVSVTVRVRCAHDKNDRLLLTPRAEKELVAAARRLLLSATAQKELVALAPNGEVFRYDGRRGLHGMLAEIEMRPSPFWLPINFGGLKAVAGREEAGRTTKRKLERRQFTGTRPFVLVLDRTLAPSLGDDEVQKGIEERFAKSTTLSAVVIQYRRLSSPGFGFAPGASWTAAFSSSMVENRRAKFPLSPAGRAVFGRVHSSG